MIDPADLSERERALVARAVADTLDFLLAHGLIHLPNDGDTPPYTDELRLQIDRAGLAKLETLRKTALP